MPAMQGGGNKSSNGVPTNAENPPATRPNKSGARRVLPHFRLPESIRGLTRWRNRQSANASKKAADRRSSGGVRFADEEEPKTEDSFDYKDIDFASEVFDFRVPVQTAGQVKKPIRPPPPPPSPLLLPESSPNKTVAFDIPMADDDEVNESELVVNDAEVVDETSQRESDEIQGEVSKEVANEVSEEVMDANDDDFTAEEKLTKFLRDHEGRELTEDDVKELERLLNETDEAELNEEADKEPVVSNAVNQTQFEDEVVDEKTDNEANAENQISHNVEESSIQLEEIPRGHTDFSVIEFNKSEQRDGSVPKQIKIVIDDFYEPVGEPVVNCQNRIHLKLPDMSGFVPPKASTNVGDPFSWRRRGMRRWDRYGYDKNNRFIPATEQIVQGCQQVENWIMSRHLSPPGYLLEVLGTNRKLKRRKKKKKKPVPSISVVYPTSDSTFTIENESYEEKVARLIIKETFEELRKNLVAHEPPADPTGEIVTTDMLVVSSTPPPQDEPLNADAEQSVAAVEIVCNLEAATNETEDIVIDEPPVEPSEDNLSEIVRTSDENAHLSRKESFIKKLKPPRPLPPTPVTMAEFNPPTRPSRRPKRVSSADRPSSVAEVRPSFESSQVPQQAQTLPRTKESSRRSVSAEEVKRRIQIQAQQFFRTPRRKELKQFSSFQEKSTNFSNTFANSTTPRRRPRAARLTPVYTPINKSCPRKKDIGSQTNQYFEYDYDDADSDSIPPPPPPKMHYLLTPSVRSSENLTGACSETHSVVDEHVTANQLTVEELRGSENKDVDEIPESLSPKITESIFSPKTFDDECVVPPEPAPSSTPLKHPESDESKVSQIAPASHLTEQSVYSSSVSSFPSHLESLINFNNLSALKLANSDFHVALFCGLLPTGGNLPSSLTELPELTVRRLNVAHLEAGFIKVAEIDAGCLKIERVEQPSTACPEPPSVVSKEEESLAEPEESQTKKNSSEQYLDESMFHGEASVIDFNGNDSLVSEKPSSWEDNSSWTGMINPSSSSASYVTCDETLQDNLTDSEFNTDVEDELERDDSSTSGCRTPTPLDLDAEREDDYDLLRQVFAAANANSHANNHGEPHASDSSDECTKGIVVDQVGDANGIEVTNDDGHVGNVALQSVKEEEHELEGHEDCVSDDALASQDLREEVEKVTDVESSSNGEVSQNAEEEQQEKDIDADDEALSYVRRSKSALSVTKRDDYHRKAIKRTVIFQDNGSLAVNDESEFRVQLVPKSNSVNTPPQVLPRKKKRGRGLAAGEQGDGGSTESFLQLPMQYPPVSSDEETSTGSSSENESTDDKSTAQVTPKSFYIAREIMTTETTFVDVLKLLSTDLQQAIAKDSLSFGQPIIPNEVYTRIFGVFNQLHSLNFVILKEIKQRIENWSTLPKISDIIIKHGPFLKLYTSYFQNYSELIGLLDDACKKFPLFNEALREFEANERCRKLEVKHYMLKPVQRIPQYRLLLNDYLKHIDETSPDFVDTKKALAVVSEVAEHANETMKETEKFAKLLQIQNNLFGGHQVVKPGRVFLREGDLAKHCRKGMQWRRFILFNDCLLHCSITSQGQLKVHHELPLSDMKVQFPKKAESPMEFSVLSVARSFILAANSTEEREDWMNALNQAIATHEAKRSTFLQARLHNQNGAGVTTRNEELLGHKAPVWVPDSRVTRCQLCLREFTLTFRRHHCRACGKVVCSLCSAQRAPLSYLGFHTDRVCYECFHILRQEIDSRLSVGGGSPQIDDSVEGGNDGSNSPQIENIRAQFKSLAPIAGEPKRIYVPKVLLEVSANDTESTICGYLNKKVRRGWKRQWFVIKDKILYAFKASEDVAALKSTPLLGFKIKTFDTAIDGINPDLVFELQAGQLSILFHAENPGSAARYQSSLRGWIIQWLEELQRAVVLE